MVLSTQYVFFSSHHPLFINPVHSKTTRRPSVTHANVLSPHHISTLPLSPLLTEGYLAHEAFFRSSVADDALQTVPTVHHRLQTAHALQPGNVVARAIDLLTAEGGKAVENGPQTPELDKPLHPFLVRVLEDLLKTAQVTTFVELLHAVLRLFGLHWLACLPLDIWRAEYSPGYVYTPATPTW